MTRILVIEDETHILENIIETLEMEGFDVQGLDDGRDSLKTALTYKPDLVLCDIMMPEVDGYNVLLNLRSEPATAAIPFIFLTALAARSEMRHGMDIGADDYLTKPFTPTELLSAVNARLKNKDLIEETHQRELNDLRQNIVYALPHELRTPLTGIIGVADYLTHDYENVESGVLQNLAGVLMRSASRLSDVIENYLLYAQLEVYSNDKGRLDLFRNNSVDYPDAIIQDTVLAVGQEAERSEDTSWDLEPACIRISHDNLAKICSELIENAYKFSSKGTPIVVTARQENENEYLISFQDQGRGMTPEQLDQVGAYMQFDRVLNEQQGLGLGLAIVQKMLYLHEGDMRITSEFGTGTTINLYIPIVN